MYSIMINHQLLCKFDLIKMDEIVQIGMGDMVHSDVDKSLKADGVDGVHSAFVNG